ncbi:MAG: hypothetical protein U0V18_03350 [Anaerolineales bacterium]
MTKQRILTTGLIVIGLVVIIFFGMNTLRAFKHMRGHGPFNGKPPKANQTDVELIRDWMTLPYIGSMYDVPPEALFFSLGIEPGKENGKKSLKELNDEFFPDQPDLAISQVKDTIKAFQTQERPPEPFPPVAPTPPSPSTQTP